MEILNYYYSNLGEMPKEENAKQTYKTICYLKDCGYDDETIFNILMHIGKERIEYEDIPECLWDDSLLKRDSFYYHEELRLVSPPPTWDEEYPFYLEMKIFYNTDMALAYFVRKFNIPEMYLEVKKELGAIKYLLDSYDKFTFAEPIDIFLYLCDYTYNNRESNTNIYSIYDMKNFQMPALQLLESEITKIKRAKLNKITKR